VAAGEERLIDQDEDVNRVAVFPFVPGTNPKAYGNTIPSGRLFESVYLFFAGSYLNFASCFLRRGRHDALRANAPNR